MENGSPAIMVLATACLGTWKPHSISRHRLATNCTRRGGMKNAGAVIWAVALLPAASGAALKAIPQNPSASSSTARPAAATTSSRAWSGPRCRSPDVAVLATNRAHVEAIRRHGLALAGRVGDEARGFCERSGDGSAAIRHRRHPGVPNRIRTGVTAVKGRCPRPLDDGDLKTFTTAGGRSGGGNRDRTGDLLHAMQALSQLSYTPTQGRELYHAAKCS